MLLDAFRMNDRVAIVTGASAGIGRASALALAEVGARVVCVARSEQKLQAVVESIREQGGQALAVTCDVNEAAQLEHVMARCLEAFGRLDVVVNNAGGSPPKPALQLSVAELEAAFHFNVSSAFLLTRLAIPHLVAAGSGSVVNISSALSHFVESAFVAYGTSKAALSHMTRLLACELAPKIRVNALAVGATLTDALAPVVDSSPELRRKMEARTPLARLGTPEDIACAVLYLASGASAWVTGKVLEIDGGTVASNWPLKIPSGI